MSLSTVSVSKNRQILMSAYSQTKAVKWSVRTLMDHLSANVAKAIIWTRITAPV